MFWLLYQQVYQKNTKLALENLTNITAVLEQLTATRQDVQRHTEEITAIREDFTQRLETTANTAVEALQRQNQQHEEYKHQSQQLIANLTNRIATLEAASRHDPNEALQQRIEQLEARPQLSMETVTQITKQQKANDDTYFFSTVSIKGFSPTELQGRSQRRAVECILDAPCDQTHTLSSLENILSVSIQYDYERITSGNIQNCCVRGHSLMTE